MQYLGDRREVMVPFLRHLCREKLCLAAVLGLLASPGQGGRWVTQEEVF